MPPGPTARVVKRGGEGHAYWVGNPCIRVHNSNSQYSPHIVTPYAPHIRTQVCSEAEGRAAIEAHKRLVEDGVRKKAKYVTEEAVARVVKKVRGEGPEGREE